MKKNHKYLFIILMFLSLLLITILGSINIPKMIIFALRGAETNGTITKLEPNNHASIYYSYIVRNVKYSGLTQGSGKENPLIENLKINDNMKIFYDPLFPQRSMAGNPKSNLVNELVAILMVGIIFPLMIVIFFKLRTV